MRSFSALLLSVLAAAVHGAALPPANAAPPTDYDAIIVGGGPAGLSAVSGLARVRRKVLLIDSGEYRNGVTRHMHDVIGFDGKLPFCLCFLPCSPTNTPPQASHPRTSGTPRASNSPTTAP
jgi:choline dehydrogenase-like flavoprotein